MTPKEITIAESLMEPFTHRTETAWVDGGGQCLTAYWLDGGQKIFYSLLAVAEHTGDMTAIRYAERAAGADQRHDKVIRDQTLRDFLEWAMARHESFKWRERRNNMSFHLSGNSRVDH